MGLYSSSFYFTLYMLEEYKPEKLTGIRPYPVSGFELLFPVLFSGPSALFSLPF
jgi:hypothetical protein